jgi:hypothetical protein
MPPINRLQPTAQKLRFLVAFALWAPAVAEPKRYLYLQQRWKYQCPKKIYDIIIASFKG